MKEKWGLMSRELRSRQPRPGRREHGVRQRRREPGARATAAGREAEPGREDFFLLC